MRSDKKVIILDNIDSDCIEQAMFILRDSRPKNIDAVKEAEQIVENYTKRYHYTLYSKMLKRRHPSKKMIACLSIAVAVVLGTALALILI
ncbi:MAG: hypothetical protein Q8882_06800 [Bacillota bacterium]|nr:hypothetical protein [Bacillota bacterium]